jgi:hypothetical protein
MSKQFEVRCGTYFEVYNSMVEAERNATSATIIIDHQERKVYVPEVIDNTFYGDFNYSIETTSRIFKEEIDWPKMRRQMEDRLRKDPSLLRLACGQLGIGIVYKS